MHIDDLRDSEDMSADLSSFCGTPFSKLLTLPGSSGMCDMGLASRLGCTPAIPVPTDAQDKLLSPWTLARIYVVYIGVFAPW